MERRYKTLNIRNDADRYVSKFESIKNALLSALIILPILTDYFMMYLPQFHNRITLGVSFLVSICAVSIKVNGQTTIKVFKIYHLLYFTFILIGTSLSILFTDNANIFRLFYVLQGLLLGLALYKNQLNHKILTVVTYTFLFFNLSFILSGVDKRFVFTGMSENGFTFHPLLIVILYYISIIENNKKIEFVPLIIGSVIAMWAGGRSGILAYGILTIFIIYGYLKMNNSNRKGVSQRVKKVIYLIISLLVGAYFLIEKDLFQIKILESAFMRFQKKGFDSPRYLMISSYVDNLKMSVSNLLIGVPFSEVEIIRLYGNNPHNSYINMHAHYGLFIILLNILLISRAMFKTFRRNKIMFGLLLTVLLRVSTDIIAFPGIFDMLIYYFIFEYSFEK